MSTLSITHIGGPTALITYRGVRLLTDPTFDEGGQDYAGPGVTLHKHIGPAISASDIGTVDAVLLSHEQHSDNLDATGREFLHQAKITLTTPDSAERLGAIAHGLAPWESYDLNEFLRVTATPARHGPVGIEPITGLVTGFIVTDTQRNKDLVYVTGDTVWYDETAEVADRFQPAVTMPFAGAARPRGPMHLTMSVNDVVELAHAFPNSKVIPVHHEGWAHFSESQDDLKAVFGALGMSDRLIPVTPGVEIVVPVQ